MKSQELSAEGFANALDLQGLIQLRAARLLSKIKHLEHLPGVKNDQEIALVTNTTSRNQIRKHHALERFQKEIGYTVADVPMKTAYAYFYALEGKVKSSTIVHRYYDLWPEFVKQRGDLVTRFGPFIKKHER